MNKIETLKAERDGLDVSEDPEPARIELPDACRIAAECLDRRHLHGVVPRPDPGGRAEVGDATLGRDAGAGEDHARPPFTDQLGESFDHAPGDCSGAGTRTGSDTGPGRPVQEGRCQTPALNGTS